VSAVRGITSADDKGRPLTVRVKCKSAAASLLLRDCASGDCSFVGLITRTEVEMSFLSIVIIIITAGSSGDDDLAAAVSVDRFLFLLR